MSVLGYVPYKPKPRGRNVLTAVTAICVEYRAWESPLTVRQIFYRLVAEYGYEKTEAAYGSLVNYVARSRRAFQAKIFEGILDEGLDASEAQDRALEDDTLIPFGWIRDEKGHRSEPYFYEDADDVIGSMKSAAKAVRLDRQAGQGRVIELWCEAAGMVPLLREIGDPYGVGVSSGGGYDSVTAKHELAKRAFERIREDDIDTLVLHVGDFDPSGEGMYETLADDVGEMVFQWWGHGAINFKRVALREDQVIEMGIETAPPKPLDSRSEGFIANHPQAVEHFGSEHITAQLEALRPPDLRELITETIERHLNLETYERVLDREKEIREQVSSALDGVNLNGSEPS